VKTSNLANTTTVAVATDATNNDDDDDDTLTLEKQGIDNVNWIN
jgi:hypothetical protein